MAFGWVTAIKETVGGIFNLAAEPIKGWQERKTIKATAKMEIEKLNAQAGVAKATAMIEMAKTGQAIESDWDARAQEQAKFSWKDEVLMLLLFFPVGVLFL